MSVYITAYAMIGYKVPKDKLDYVRDQYEEYYDNDIPIEVVDDCMSGEFAYVGIHLGSIAEDDWDHQQREVPNVNVNHLAEQIDEYFPELEVTSPYIKFYMFLQAN